MNHEVHNMFKVNLLTGFMLILLAMTDLIGCSSVSDDTTKSLIPTLTSGVTLMASQPATAVQCPNGGINYITYSDLNKNRKFDKGDQVLDAQPVCNGLNTLIASSRVQTTESACEAKSGLQVNTGVDSNGNGTLEPSEFASTQLVCDGVNGKSATISTAAATSLQCPSGGVVITTTSGLSTPESNVVCNGNDGLNGRSATISTATATLSQCATGGYVITTTSPGSSPQSNVVCNGAVGATGATGQAGRAGSNGHSMVFSVAAAPVSVCPAGGSTIVMALDINDTGSYSALYPNQQAMTVCNGKNATSTGYEIIKPIMPCGNNVVAKEVLLLLGNGQVLASYSATMSGSETRLSFIPDGTFQDTDSSRCVFTLATRGTTRSISWLGATQLSWQMPTN